MIHDRGGKRVIAKERDLLELIGKFGSLDVTVIGDAMLDNYMDGEAARMCREAPVPVVDLLETVDRAGGAANTAANVAALGANVRFVGVVGDDTYGRRLLRTIEEAGLYPGDLIVARGRETLSKCRLVANNQLIARIDSGDTQDVDEETEARLVATLAQALSGSDLLIISDYGYGTVTSNVVATLGRLLKHYELPVVVDSKFPERYRELGVTAVKPNYGEVIRLLGLASQPADRAAQLEPYEEKLLELTGARMVAATLDKEGALIIEREAPSYRTYSDPMPNSHATGAGDTYTAALALALAADADAPTAAECAAAAARIVVSTSGTTVCEQQELLAALSLREKATELGPLLEALREARDQGKRIVFTNGCFDILHRGHVTYLSKAKSLGDVLVVAVNSDEQVRDQKGPGRPINSLEDRMSVLAGLSCVDFVVPFFEPTPARLIEQVRPHIFVKGGDYTESTLPEAPVVRRLGGRIELLPYLSGQSTTGIVERIRNGSNGSAKAPGGAG